MGAGDRAWYHPVSGLTLSAAPCKLRGPMVTHTCLVYLSICRLQNPGQPGKWRQTAGGVTHIANLSWARSPSPMACRAKRPGTVQRLTMEGRGCRREVPGLTLVLFLGQKKASSCLATAVLEKTPAGQQESARPGGGACRRGSLGAGAHSQTPAGEHVALSAPPPLPCRRLLPARGAGVNENNRASPPGRRTRPEMAPWLIKE